MAGSSLVASDAAQVTLGRAGAGLVAAAIMIATIGSNNGIVLTAARVPYAMARDGLLPRWLGGVHPRFLTPVPSLAVQGAISIALTLISTEPSWRNSYNRLFTYVVLAEFVFYAMSCGAVIRLRHAAPDPRLRALGLPGARPPALDGELARQRKPERREHPAPHVSAVVVEMGGEHGQCVRAGAGRQRRQDVGGKAVRAEQLLEPRNRGRVSRLCDDVIRRLVDHVLVGGRGEPPRHGTVPRTRVGGDEGGERRGPHLVARVAPP